MASIHFKKSNTGKKTYYVVIPSNYKHKWIRAGSLKNAKILKKEIDSLKENEMFDNFGLTTQDIRIDDFFQDYADYIKLRTAPGTVKRYLSVLNTFVTFLKMFHPNLKYLGQINSIIIESYQKQRLKSVDLKVAADGNKPGLHFNKRLPLPQTVNNELIMLGSAFIWAHKNELIPSVPTRKVKKLRPMPKRQARIMSEKECQYFLRVATEMSKKNNYIKTYVNVFKFLLNTGLRSGELCNLTWDDVDLKTSLIKIQPKDGWTPKSYSREFFLNEITLNLLKSLPKAEKFVFMTESGKQLDTDSIRRVLIKIAKAAGFSDLTRVHDLRHTFNSLMQMNGVDAATMGKILGHKDIETTMIYTHQTHEHLKKCIEKVGI